MSRVEEQLEISIFRGALEEICEEMDLVYERTAFSPVISDGWDRASGIYDARTGDVIAQGARGLPIFVGVMQFSVQAVVRWFESMEPGDVFMVNDPYAGGTHLMDVKMVKPVFVDGKVACFVANTGHWPDIGGRVPGGFTSEATEIYQEGLRLPPVRIVRRGQLVEDVRNIISLNVRVPQDLMGDIQAQLSGLEYGERQVRRLIEDRSAGRFVRLTGDLRRHAEKSMRSHIDEIPDGTYEATELMDNDGVEDERLKIAVAVTVAGSDMRIDLAGSSGPCQGPLNSVLSATVSSCYVAIKHLYPDVPLNAGCFLPIDVVASEDTFLNARPPRPVSGCSAETSQRIITAIHKALAPAIPELVPASSFATVSNLSMGGLDENGDGFVLYSFLGGGYGAYADADGLSNGCSLISLARTQAMEVLEQRYPIRIQEYALVDDSGGAGEHRGGLGVRLRIVVERECRVSVLADRAFTPAEGLDGGGPGGRLELTIYGPDGAVKIKPPMGSKGEGLPLEPGDVVEIVTPGGGGHGDPQKRAAQSVEYDLRNEYVSDLQWGAPGN
jgi:N-methylhydantoinase B